MLIFFVSKNGKLNKSHRTRSYILLQHNLIKTKCYSFWKKLVIRTSVILDTLYCAVEGICITMLIVGSMIFVVLCLLQILENLYLQSGRLNRIYAWLGRLRIRAFQAHCVGFYVRCFQCAECSKVDNKVSRCISCTLKKNKMLYCFVDVYLRILLYLRNGKFILTTYHVTNTATRRFRTLCCDTGTKTCKMQ